MDALETQLMAPAETVITQEAYNPTPPAKRLALEDGLEDAPKPAKACEGSVDVDVLI